MNKKPLVSFVVVNWDGLANTKECLQSIRKTTFESYEIVVVDNGSRDGSKEYFTSQKNIRFVDLPKNTGFTGGHLAGANVAQGKYLAILNNDLVIDKNWLARGLETLERHRSAALVGGKGFYWNDKNPAYNTQNEFYSYQEVDPVSGYTKTLLTGEDECSVDAISGAALLIDRKAFEKVGYLDDDFFAYYEETDLIARLKRAGYEAYYNPTMHTWHQVAASSGGGESDFYLRQMHRNRYFFAYKNYDPLNLRRFLSLYSGEVSRARIKKLLRRTDRESTARLAAYKEVKEQKKTLEEKRRQVLKLGETYNSKLGAYKPQDVTIIIPCYNYGAYVREAIDSALKQSIKPTRIIVINDGSTDNSLAEIKKFKDNPLIEIVNKKNEGVIAAKNLGISMSKTYWTMFLDADDTIDEDTLRIMLKSVATVGHADVVYSDMKLFGAISDYFRARPFQPSSFLAKNYVNNTTLINTTSLKRSGGYKEIMAGGIEDWELYITLFEQGAQFRYIPQPLVNYRQHGDALRSRNSELQDIENGRKHYALIQSIHPGVFKKHTAGYGKIIRLASAGYLLLRHPGVIVVIIKSIPGACIQALRYMLHKARLYLQNK